MQVIFLKDFLPLARKGEVRDVASGYARNYLFPHGIAAFVTQERIKFFHDRATHKQERHTQKLKKLKEILKKIQYMKIRVKVHTNREGKLYAGLSPRQIASELLSKKHRIPERFIQLAHPIKKVGEYKVPIGTTAENVGSIHLEVVGESSE